MAAPYVPGTFVLGATLGLELFDLFQCSNGKLAPSRMRRTARHQRVSAANARCMIGYSARVKKYRCLSLIGFHDRLLSRGDFLAAQVECRVEPRAGILQGFGIGDDGVVI